MWPLEEPDRPRICLPRRPGRRLTDPPRVPLVDLTPRQEQLSGARERQPPADSNASRVGWTCCEVTITLCNSQFYTTMKLGDIETVFGVDLENLIHFSALGTVSL